MDRDWAIGRDMTVGSNDQPRDLESGEHKKRQYEPPRITAYEVPGLLNMIGPAVACIRWDPSAAPPPGANRYEDEPEDW